MKGEDFCKKHGSTYGRNPLAVSVGRQVLAIISDKKFLKNVKNKKYHSNKIWQHISYISWAFVCFSSVCICFLKSICLRGSAWIHNVSTIHQSHEQ